MLWNLPKGNRQIVADYPRGHASFGKIGRLRFTDPR
jgi:hypothetical protein